MQTEFPTTPVKSRRPSRLERMTRHLSVAWVVSIGFGLIILMLLTTLVVGLYAFSYHNHHLAEVSDSAIRKIHLAFNMRDAIRERIDLLRVMPGLDDPFDRDEQRMIYFSHSGRYTRAREELLALATHPQERHLMEILDRAARDARPANGRALNLLAQIELPPARQLLPAVGEAIMRHLDMLNPLQRMLQVQQRINREALAEAEKSVAKTFGLSILMGAIAMIIAVLTAWVVILRISEKNRQLSHQATHDSLTGLPNRTAFENTVNWALRESAEDDSQHVLLYMDLDQFKLVNDTKGHQAGDELLCNLSDTMHAQLRQSDMLARLGGDEFGVLLRYTDANSGETVANKLRQTVEDYEFHYRGDTFRVGVSIGMTPFNGREYTLERLLSIADASCYAAKDGGRNQVHRSDTHQAELTQRSGEMRWATRISEAINQDQFLLVGQSMRALSDRGAGERILIELLIRLRDPGSETLIPPGQFLPAAERYGLMGNIDRWVVKHALQWITSLGIKQKEITACINIHAGSASDSRFTEFLYSEITNSGVDPAALCFEITESAAVHNLSAACALIERVGSLGCRFALDDFGSGLSSFSYLRNLDVDYLKIDGSYICNIDNSPTDRALVASINNIAQTLGKATIAEYAENEHVVEILDQMGLDFAQGFVVQHPAPLEELEAQLSDRDEPFANPVIVTA